MTPSPQSDEERRARAKQITNKALRARVAIGLSGLAVLASVVTLATKVTSARTVIIVLGFVAVLIVLTQLLLRTYLMQLEQQSIVLKTDEAAKELQAIKWTTEEELRAEERQSKHLEQLFTAMKAFKLIQVESLDMLHRSQPATSFYLLRHTSAIADVLGGHWDRTEALLPSQLWREYRELVARLKPGEIFRSTVCLPSDLALLFDDQDFKRYVAAIYEAANSRGVYVKRLFVLNSKKWPPDKEELHEKVRDHLRKLQSNEHSTLEARVTSDTIAREHFNRHPDFMVWHDNLLIKSDIQEAGGLVTQAEFYFTSTNYTEEIRKRQQQFDELFNDPEQALPLTEIL